MSPGSLPQWKRRSAPEQAARPVDGTVVADRSEHLRRALELAGDHFPDDDVQRGERLLAKARQRTGLGAGHTIVALAGATGSGKSSLFNALVGAEVAQTGVTRPTTSRAGAATWGRPPHELLDWVGVAGRHEVSPSTPSYPELEGLVLLDLPDIDSRATSNRAEADRVLELCDVFVWVTDPQKYADGLLHEQYVREFALTKAASVVVLNQIDRLSPQDGERCLDDLRRLLAQDGLPDAPVVAASSVSPDGSSSLLAALAEVVQAHNAADRRLLGDLTVEAQRLSSHVGSQRGDRTPTVDAELVQALEQAAGVPLVLDAVERDHQRASAGATGWPFTRWAQRLRPRPLSRLGLDQTSAPAGEAREHVTLSRSSLPPATPAARAAVDLAGRRLGDRAAAGMPPSWADEIHDAVAGPGARVSDALDQAILSVPLQARRPRWWALAGICQWIFAVVALAGLVWLLLLAGLASVQIHLEAPTLGSWLPIPLVLLVGGLVAGLLLAVLARALSAQGAKRARNQARRRLDEAIENVARDRIVEPVAQIVRRHDECAAELAEAAS